MQVQILFLLPMAFLLPPRAQAGEIIGGHEAEPHSRPYMAHLLIQRANKSRCGGFLVKPTVVLTAAHCQGESITVVLGAHNVSQWEPSQQVIPVQRQIPHPQYNRKTLNNDIMILQLAKSSQLGKWVKTIPLPEDESEVEPEDVCSVSGWGKISLEEHTNTLHVVNLTVTEDHECKARYPASYEPDTMLCVGNPRKKKTAFEGDSGSPLVCKKKAQGIVSYGNSRPLPPRVFTRIASFLPWIQETLEQF
uniref:Granzyme B-like n=1 Tax=Pelodiscus sinensis TaxID=13735 RepID=K7GDF8_PELSI